MKKILLFTLLFTGFLFLLNFNKLQSLFFKQSVQIPSISIPVPVNNPYASLEIENMRKGSYPGSNFVIEQILPNGANYNSYLVSYLSEGFKIDALLTVPFSVNQDEKFPAIIFNHGYILPEQYETTMRYVSYVDAFARSGYVVLKPDYRGHGNSEGKAEGAYVSSAYTIDVLNALASLKKYEKVNPEKIGMWGHSMGGHITLKSMVISPDIKVGVIWGGVVGTYQELIFDWPEWRRQKGSAPVPTVTPGRVRQRLRELSNNREVLKVIDPINYLQNISGPIQLHHGLSDEEVPPQFSETLKKKLEENGKIVELYEYPGADHNISGASFSPAIQRSVEFFDKYLK